MAMLGTLLFSGLAACSSASGAGQQDVSALIQDSLRMHRMDESQNRSDGELQIETSQFVDEGPWPPYAVTKLGAIKGVDMGTYSLFSGVPYAESPERFEAPKPKKPWWPETLDATEFAKACIGARTQLPEDEDCLHLNIWIPKGEHKNMPVVIYFHGGMNQHGSGSEVLRRGDGITQNKKFPTIWINFDFRLGIYGWMDLENSGVQANLGLRDQQLALRWVKENIRAFGGDPDRVTLQGQSEGCATILVHMTAPGSQGLFSRVVMHSPVTDMWSRNVNRHRTDFMVKRANCQEDSANDTLACLKRMGARKLWGLDWVSEELSRNVGQFMWLRNMWGMTRFTMQAKDKSEVIGELGWHPVVDGDSILEEPREAIRQGRFAKVPVLITISKNETWGVIPQGDVATNEQGLQRLLRKGDYEWVKRKYIASLTASGIDVAEEIDLLNQMTTDKLWTCDARWLAHDITEGGGKGYVGMFWHSPKFDPVGTRTSPVCVSGATCHAAEMFYVLPQGGDRGIHGFGMEGELAFSRKYSNSFLAFVNGNDTAHPWQVWNETQPMTFYDKTGTRVVPFYRKPQCDVLDQSMGQYLPSFLRDIPHRTL